MQKVELTLADYLDLAKQNIFYNCLLIIFVFLGPALFLINYPDRNIIGFTCLIVSWFFCFVLWQIKKELPEIPSDKAKEIKIIKDNLKKVEKKKEKYSIWFYIFLFIFVIFLPIISFIVHIVISNQFYFNVILSITLIGFSLTITYYVYLVQTINLYRRIVSN